MQGDDLVRDAIKAACFAIASVVLALAILCAVAWHAAHAHDHEHPEWDQWFASLRMPDFPRESCCGPGEAYWADSYAIDGDKYVAIVTDERDVPGRRPIPVGTGIVIPIPKIKYDQGNPTGHGIVFISPNEALGYHVQCYLPPGGV